MDQFIFKIIAFQFAFPKNLELSLRSCLTGTDDEAVCWFIVKTNRLPRLAFAQLAYDFKYFTQSFPMLPDRD